MGPTQHFWLSRFLSGRCMWGDGAGRPLVPGGACLCTWCWDTPSSGGAPRFCYFSGAMQSVLILPVSWIMVSPRGDDDRHSKIAVKTLIPALFWWWGDGKKGAVLGQRWKRAPSQAALVQGKPWVRWGAPRAVGLWVAGECPLPASKSVDIQCHFQSLPSSPGRFGRRQSILQRREGRRHGDFCKWRWAGPHPVGPSHVPSHWAVSQTCAAYPSAKAKC